MTQAPRKVAVDAALWRVTVRTDLSNGQVEYDLNFWTEWQPGTASTLRYPHPRGWEDQEQLVLTSSMRGGEPHFEGIYVRAVAVTDDPDVSWVLKGKRYGFTAVNFKRALKNPAGMLAEARDTFDGLYGVEPV